MEKMQCERLDSLFIFVSAVRRSCHERSSTSTARREG
jgi:hypothetical protein